MSLVRWNPIRDLVSMREEVDRLFDNFFRGGALETSLARGSWEPAVDISETASNFSIMVEQIEAKFKDGVLTLTLPKAEEARPKEIPIKIS